MFYHLIHTPSTIYHRDCEFFYFVALSSLFPIFLLGDNGDLDLMDNNGNLLLPRPWRRASRIKPQTTRRAGKKASEVLGVEVKTAAAKR